MTLTLKKLLKFPFLIFCLSLLFFSFPPKVQAEDASLYLSPLSGTYQVGSNFPVEIMLKSESVSANAAGAEILFNNDQLEVISMSKSGSIFSLWTTEPTFSNSSGRIEFEGGSPASFKGNSGKIITVTFRAKVSSTSKVTFSSGSVLAADGKGTNILGSMNGGSYTLKPSVVIPEAESETEYVPPFTMGVPSAPVITSETHSDPEEWYSNKNPVFKWNLPQGTTAVRVLFGENPRSSPAVLYSPPISEKAIEDVEDGIWYFHCQLKNDYGWGGITHFKVKIDTVSPEPFGIEVKGGNKTKNPRPILLFNTTDSLSGLDYYEVRVGNAEPQIKKVAEVESNPYQLDIQMPGRINAFVRAVDRAGNSQGSVAEIEILPIDPPIITTYPKTLSGNEPLVLKGLASSDSEVYVYLKDKEGRSFLESTKSTDSGIFYLVSSKYIPEGEYEIWAELINSEGARSSPSQKLGLEVKRPTFLKIGGWELDYNHTLIFFVSLFIFFVVWNVAAYIFLKKRRETIFNEAEELKEFIENSFGSLEKEMGDGLNKIDKIKALEKQGKRGFKKESELERQKGSLEEIRKEVENKRWTLGKKKEEMKERVRELGQGYKKSREERKKDTEKLSKKIERILKGN